MTNSSPQPSHRSVPISWKSARLSLGSAPFLFATAFIYIHRKVFVDKWTFTAVLSQAPVTLAPVGWSTFAGRQQDSDTATTILFPKPVRHFHSGWSVGWRIIGQSSQLFGLCD